MIKQSLNLFTDTTASYDQTKTTLLNRAQVRTFNSTTVIGIPQTKAIDFFTDTGIAPSTAMYASPNGRIFVMGAITAGLGSLMLYSFNTTTAAYSYLGRIVLTFPNNAATTHTITGLKVVDSGTTGWYAFISTAGSVLVNGGLFMANAIALADFSISAPPTIGFATTAGQKAMYFLQDPSAKAGATVLTAPKGIILDTANTSVYVHNGVAATHQYYKFDYTVASTLSPATVTITIATPGVCTLNAHGFNNNDQVVFATSGALPTGLTAGTTYYARNVAANTFEVSLTTGGASINTTGTQSGTHTVEYAHGISTAQFTLKTGNLPALSGTLLATNSEDFANPGHTANSGFDCAFFATTTLLYLGKLSELTSLITTWPSLLSVNITPSLSDTPTAIASITANWMSSIDRAIFSTNASRFVIKSMVNTSNDAIIGTLNTIATEASVATPREYYEFGAVTVASCNTQDGWLFIAPNTALQRCLLFVDIRSDPTYDWTYAISPVLTTDDAGQYNALIVNQVLPGRTNRVRVWYRTSDFTTATSGTWNEIIDFSDLSGIVVSSSIQFRFGFPIFESSHTLPAQISNADLYFTGLFETSRYLEYSYEHSDTGTPTRVAWRIKRLYDTAVPTLYFRAHNTSNALLTSANTVADDADFEYSTNDGSSWIPLGTIPNTIGTLIRYNFSSPPGVDIRPSLRES